MDRGMFFLDGSTEVGPESVVDSRTIPFQKDCPGKIKVGSYLPLCSIAACNLAQSAHHSHTQRRDDSAVPLALSRAFSVV